MLWQVSFYGADGQCKSSFFPFSGVTEEFKAFINDVSQSTHKVFRIGPYLSLALQFMIIYFISSVSFSV